ncbi:autotransporter domain-containing protein [Stenotrophomonas rhizophila]
MNHVYRVVFNHALKCVQVVSEVARGGRGVARTERRRTPRLAPLFTGITLACMAPAALAVTTVWVGPPGTEWNVGSSWNNGVPTADDMVYVNNGGVRITGTHVPDADEVHIGRTLAGRLDIFAGGRLDTETLYMGTQADSRGVALINGPGSQWNARRSIGVGHFGTGELSILNGGSMTIDGESYIASMGGSTGSVRIAGADSTWNTGNTLFAGQAGIGTVEVTWGGSLNGHDAIVGNQVGSEGRIKVSGTGSAADYTGSLTVGRMGQGTYEVHDGASATVGHALMGEFSGSRGDILVAGAGSSWISSSLSVGEAGQGSFTVTQGATAEIGGGIILASNTGASGTITVGPNALMIVGTQSSNPVLFNGAGTSRFDMAGGTLRTGSAMNLDTAVLLSANSTFDVDGSLTASRAFSGTGTLLKTGTGELTLRGESTGWTGALQVDAGTVNLQHTAALGGGWLGLADGTTLGLADGVAFNNSVQMLGEVAVTVASGASATLAGNVSGSGSTTLVKRDAGTLTLGGGTVGETRVEGGSLRVTGNALNGGNIEIGSGATFETDTTRVLQYAGQFSGSGTLRQGRHFLTLTGDSSAFTGTTVVNGGMLEVTGALGGDIQMTNNALLAGTGSVGSAHLLSGSVLSPGSRQLGSVGRLSMSGDLVFDPSATYQVDVAADGRSDLVSVAGQATLGTAGTVAVAAAGNWAVSTRYTVLTAGDGVAGTFAGVSSNFAFLDPTLSYDANNVYLTMARNDVSMPEVELAFPDVVVNANQKAVAGAVEALGAGNAVYDAVVRLEVPQVVPAFDSLGGEIHAAARTALLQDRFLRDGIHQRLDGAAVSGVLAGNTGVWVAGSGNSLRMDADGVGARSRVQQQGLMAGADWRISERVLLGVAVGEQTLTNRLDDRQAKADADATEYGVYGQFQGEHFGLRGGVSRTDYRIDTTRAVTVGSTLSQPLAARSDATATRVFARAGWDFTARTLTLTPEIELAHVRLRSDRIAETGGNSALQVQANRDELSTGVAALRAVWDISGGQRDRAALTARVGWQYADGDLGAATRARFENGDTTFAMQSVPLARSMGLAELGVAVNPTTASRLSLQAQTSAGDGQRDVGVQLNWSVQF